MRDVPASSLILDYNLYPRHELDKTNVREMIRALDAGVTLPPVVADRESRRAVDGFHRITAALRVQGPDAKLDVDFKKYDSEAEMLLDAIRLNASHGKRLMPYDKARCLILAGELKIDNERLASALSMTTARLTELEMHKIAFSTDPGMIPTPVAIKGTIGHLGQKQITAAQSIGNELAGGGGQLFYVNQVINILEHDLLDKGDGRMLERLKHLESLLSTLLVAA